MKFLAIIFGSALYCVSALKFEAKKLHIQGIVSFRELQDDEDQSSPTISLTTVNFLPKPSENLSNSQTPKPQQPKPTPTKLKSSQSSIETENGLDQESQQNDELNSKKLSLKEQNSHFQDENDYDQPSQEQNNDQNKVTPSLQIKKLQNSQSPPLNNIKSLPETKITDFQDIYDDQDHDDQNQDNQVSYDAQDKEEYGH